MLKSKGKTCMVEAPSHVKHLSLNHVCKIGLRYDVAGVMLEEQRFPLLECIIHDTNSHHTKKNKQVPQSNYFIATI
jgi:hypothetical protein